MDDFYVYALERADKGEICYIGKGKGDRRLQHERQSVTHANPILRRIFHKTQVTSRIIVDGLDEQSAFGIEKDLIALYKRKKDGGVLANLTDGGEGVSGLVMPQAAREKIAEKARGNKRQLGMKRTKESRRKMSEAATGRPLSEQARAKVVMALTGRRVSEETREKIGSKSRGRKHTAETRARLSASHKGRVPAIAGKKHSVEAREKMSASHLGKQLPAEHRAKISGALKGRTFTQEHRDRLSQAAKEREARKRLSA